jgi:hypothetical protein
MKNLETDRVDELPPDQNSDSRALQKGDIVSFWNELRICGDPSATTWDVLEPLEQQVTEFLARDDLESASRLTAKAWCLMAGGE